MIDPSFHLFPNDLVECCWEFVKNFSLFFSRQQGSNRGKTRLRFKFETKRERMTKLKEFN